METSHKSVLIALMVAFMILVPNSYAQSSRARQNPNSIVNNSDKPLHILLKPDPVLTDEVKQQIAEGDQVVKLRVEFLDVGLIGAITPVDTFPTALTDAAVEAAGRIKFEPEKKKGRPVTVYRVIDYQFGQPRPEVEKIEPENLAKARAIVQRAVEVLGGQKYLQVRSQVGRGKFSIIRNGINVSFQSFTDVIVYPDKEITEFKEHGIKTVQANYGEAGWIFNGNVETIENQSPEQIENFKRSMRLNLDNFLRGVWRTEDAQLSYVGRRQAGPGKRNEVVKLAFDDGFSVEFEFSDDGFPVKSIYTRLTSEGREINEEDRFAQFVDVQGIKTPYIIDHFINGVHTSRINYQSVEFRQTISDSVFAKPANIKDLKKDLKP